MGDSQARRWRWLGTYHFWRTRGKETLQPVEPFLKIAVVGAPAAHYLGLTPFWSVAFGISIIVGSELAMLVLGWFDSHQGVIRRQQQLNNIQDDVKMQTLYTLQDILKELQDLRGVRTK